MTRYMQSCILGSILGLATFLPGCTQDNQTAAKIQGTVPTDNLTPQERRQQVQQSSSASLKAAGYPGAGGSAPSSSGGNRRSQ